jgi:hypothetical protein
LAHAQRLGALSLQAGPDGATNLLASRANADDGQLVVSLYALEAELVAELGHFKPPQLYPPQWAAAVLPGPMLSVAVTSPGGVASPLLYWRSDETDACDMSPTDGLPVFKAPRTVRHAPGAQRFVAIESRDQSALVTLFTSDVEGQWTVRPLAEDDSIDEAVIMPTGHGWLLLYKSADGAGAGEATRSRNRIPMGQTTLGEVTGLLLDDAWAPVAPAFVVPTGGPLYEFDADLHDRRLVVAGISPAGYRVSELILEAEGVNIDAQSDVELAAPAGAPSVLLQGGSLDVVLIDAVGTPAAGVVHWRQ